jgi:hypothetical protein
MASSRPKSGGYTLLETVVVVATMVILATMLMPVIEKARGRAKYVRWGEFSHAMLAEPSLVLYYNFVGDRDSTVVHNHAILCDSQRINPHSLDGNLGLYADKSSALSQLWEPLHVPGGFKGDATLREIWASGGRFPGKDALSFSPGGNSLNSPYHLCIAPRDGTSQLAQLLQNDAQGRSEQQFTIAFWINTTPGLAEGIVSNGTSGTSLFNWSTNEQTSGIYVIRIRTFGIPGLSGRRMRFQVRDFSEANYDIGNDPAGVIDSSWQFWVFTFHWMSNTPGLPNGTSTAYTRIFLNNHRVDSKKDVGHIVYGVSSPLEGLAGGTDPVGSGDPRLMRNYLCLFYCKKAGSKFYKFWGQCDEFALWDKDLSYDQTNPDSDLATNDPKGNDLSLMYLAGAP